MHRLVAMPTKISQTVQRRLPAGAEDGVDLFAPSHLYGTPDDFRLPHLGEACLGQISEVFDAEEPWAPRGCAAQAWSVAEVLRGWVKTA